MPDRPFEDFFSMSSSEISHIISHQFFKQIFTNNEKGLWMAFFFLWRLKSWKFIAVSVSVYVNRRLRILEEKKNFYSNQVILFCILFSKTSRIFSFFSNLSVEKTLPAKWSPLSTWMISQHTFQSGSLGVYWGG